MNNEQLRYESDDDFEDASYRLRHFLRRQAVRSEQLGGHVGGVESYVKKWFEKFDSDRSGDMDGIEFRNVLRAMLDDNSDEFTDKVPPPLDSKATQTAYSERFCLYLYCAYRTWRECFLS